MAYRKKLIEVALPLEAINEASAREKLLRHGHPSTLHLWWARRPLAACRAVIFASLVDDPDDPAAPPDFVAACRKLPRGKNAADHDAPRQRLFDFIETLVQWESMADQQVLKTARELIRLATGGNPPPLLDPFAGGGSIPLEAQRLGLEAHASDLNPVAVMINKALIEIPPKFANMPPVNPRDRQKLGGADNWTGAAGLAADVRYYGEWIRNRAWERIGHLYPTYDNGETVIAWLWTRTVKCPNPACGVWMPLVRSFDLSTKKGKKAWVEPRRSPKAQHISFVVKQGGGKGPEGTINRQGAACVACGTPVPFDYIRAEGKGGRIKSQLMAIVAEGKNGRSYYAPAPEHEQIAQVAIPDSVPDTNLPEQALGFRVQLYGMTKHRDLFTPRQLVALTTFSDLVTEAQQQIATDALAAGLTTDDMPLRDGGVGAKAYAEALSVYLAFAVDRCADYWSSLIRWQAANQQMSNTFSRQALSMLWDYVEANPFSGRNGSFDNLFSWTIQSIPLLPSQGRGYVKQQDAATGPMQPQCLFSTDPPYYDNIGYADLSDYFYIWLRRILKYSYPSIFGTLLVPKESELIANPYRFNGDREAANQHFESGMEAVFSRIRSFSDSAYPLTVFYAFKQSEKDDDETQDGFRVSSTGWETMLEGLVHAGYTVDGTWPISTELANRTRNLESNALASSIILVCRPRLSTASVTSRREFVNTLRQELPAALRDMQSGNIAPVDLAQASIGPGMAVYSRYDKVLEPNGERLSVRTALQIINHELDTYLAEQEGDIDADSRFAVAWFEQFGFREGPFGQADVLARAKNTSVDGLASAGVLEAGTGKVRLYPWSELDPDWDPTADRRLTTWEAVHHLIQQLNTHGEEGAARLLAKMSPDLAAEARQLAYRLYSICERKGWAQDALAYNSLITAWPEISRLALSTSPLDGQGELIL